MGEKMCREHLHFDVDHTYQVSLESPKTVEEPYSRNLLYGDIYIPLSNFDSGEGIMSSNHAITCN